jgi:CDP-6-deoxy-D-xylo-4-hexulose-3-dehydrase
VANILGTPGDLGSIEDWCEERNIPLLEDNCESLGARTYTESGRLCGTFGIVSTLSFYHSHQLSAIEGGAILTDQAGIAKACRMLRNHGWTKGVENPQSFGDEYKFVDFGYNVRPLELHAALVRAQLPKIDFLAESRRRGSDLFAAIVKDFDLEWQSYEDQDGRNPFNFSFLLETEKLRDYVAFRLRQVGMDCRPVVGGALHMQPYYHKLNMDGAVKAKLYQPLKRALAIHQRGLSIGIPLDHPKQLNASHILRTILGTTL